jgi:hypothetical protein
MANLRAPRASALRARATARASEEWMSGKAVVCAPGGALVEQEQGNAIPGGDVDGIRVGRADHADHLFVPGQGHDARHGTAAQGRALGSRGGIARLKVKIDGFLAVAGRRDHQHGPAQDDLTQAALRAREWNHQAESHGVGRGGRGRGGLESQLPAHGQGFLFQLDGVGFVATGAQCRRRLAAENGPSEDAVVDGQGGERRGIGHLARDLR